MNVYSALGMVNVDGLPHREGIYCVIKEANLKPAGKFNDESLEMRLRRESNRKKRSHNNRRTISYNLYGQEYISAFMAEMSAKKDEYLVGMTVALYVQINDDVVCGITPRSQT